MKYPYFLKLLNVLRYSIPFMQSRSIILVLLIFGLLLLGCENKVVGKPHSYITPGLIAQCVDSTLALDPGLNTPEYWFDPGMLDSLNKSSVQAYLLTNATIKIVNSDSLVVSDSNWVKYGFFTNAVLRFNSVIKRRDGIIEVHTSKTKASDGSIQVELLFRKTSSGYKCLKSEITTIS